MRFDLSYDIKITLKSHCFPKICKPQVTSGLSILLYGVISLRDAVSYDK